MEFENNILNQHSQGCEIKNFHTTIIIIKSGCNNTDLWILGLQFAKAEIFEINNFEFIQLQGFKQNKEMLKNYDQKFLTWSFFRCNLKKKLFSYLTP